MKGVHLQPQRVINGSFGELLDADGLFLGQTQEVRFRITHETKTWKPLGTVRAISKVIGVSGSGSIDLFKVSSAYLAKLAAPLWDPHLFLQPETLTINLDDPESFAAESVILTNVRFTSWEGGWRTNDLVLEQVQFTFSGIQMPLQIDQTVENLYGDADLVAAYQQQRNVWVGFPDA